MRARQNTSSEREWFHPLCNGPANSKGSYAVVQYFCPCYISSLKTIELLLSSEKPQELFPVIDQPFILAPSKISLWRFQPSLFVNELLIVIIPFAHPTNPPEYELYEEEARAIILPIVYDLLTATAPFTQPTNPPE